MTALDYFVLGITGLSFGFGLIKGFVRSAMALIMTIAGFFLAVIGYTRLAPLVRGAVETDVMADLVAFFSIFVGVVLLGMGLGRAIRSALKKAHLSWLDHLAGGGFGFVRGWFICSVMYLGLTAFPIQLDLLAQAKLTPYLIRGAEMLTHSITEKMKTHFKEGYQKLQTGPEESSSGE
jgi:membrane protein required for colicin V production